MVEKIPGTKLVADRLVAQEDHFVGTLQERGEISREDAVKVSALYRKLRVVKRKGLSCGDLVVTHGGFMSKEVIRRALKRAEDEGV